MDTIPSKWAPHPILRLLALFLFIAGVVWMSHCQNEGKKVKIEDGPAEDHFLAKSSALYRVGALLLPKYC